MDEFAGIVRFDGSAPFLGGEESLVRTIGAWGKGLAHARRSPGALIVQLSPHLNSRAAASAGPKLLPDDKALFAAQCCLDNREELETSLQIPSGESNRAPDTILLRTMFERWSGAGIARCLGAFAFAHWDATARRLTLGRDCVGARTLVFHCGDGFVAFASTYRILLSLPFVPRELDEHMLADFLAFNMREPRKTIYKSIERVPTRSLVTIDPGGVHHQHYWSPNCDAPPPYRRDEDYVMRARELFDQAVRSVTAGNSHVAISTSGGLDSSAIAATAARLGRSERITCYTLVPPPSLDVDVGPGNYLDETGKLQALKRMHPQLEVALLSPTAPHPLCEDPNRYFARMAHPTTTPANLEWFSFLYDAVAAAGHKSLLVGTHGNFGLTWTGAFSLLSLLRDGGLGAFMREFFATARNGRGIARTIISEMLTPSATDAQRRLVQRLQGRHPYDVARYSALNSEYVTEHDLRQRWRTQGFNPWFRPSGRSPARHRANLLFDRNQPARDLVAMSAEYRGFEIRDPHADRRVLEFSLSVPEAVFRRNGIPRSFARAVFADRLPHEILDEQRRGVQGGDWFGLANHRRKDTLEEIERLSHSSTASRLIDLPRLRQMMDRWPKDARDAETRAQEYRFALSRAIHVGRFIRWAERSNT